MHLRFRRVRPGAESGQASSRCQARLRCRMVSSGRPATLKRGRIVSRLRRCSTSSLAERHAGPSAFLHRRLVLAAPGVGEGEPVERMAERLEDCLGLARDAGAPVDQRAEHVEEQSLGERCHAAMIANCRGPAQGGSRFRRLCSRRGVAIVRPPFTARTGQPCHIPTSSAKPSRSRDTTATRAKRITRARPARPRRRRRAHPPHARLGRMDHRDRRASSRITASPASPRISISATARAARTTSARGCARRAACPTTRWWATSPARSRSCARSPTPTARSV